MLKINSYRLFFLALFFNHSSTLGSSFTPPDSDQYLPSLPLPSSTHNASTPTNPSGLGSNMPNNNTNFDSLLSDLFATSLRNAQQVTHTATMGNLTLNGPNFINGNNNNTLFSIPYTWNLNATANALFGANNNSTLPSVLPNAADTSTNMSNIVVPMPLLENRESAINFSANAHTNNHNMPSLISDEQSSNKISFSIPPHTNQNNQSALTQKNNKKKKSTKAYTCPTCNKTLACHRSLNYHLKTHDPNRPRPFQCGVCNKSFFRKCNLINHMVTHTGEKPYKCHICEKGLSSKIALKGHLNKHRGEKPYECNICKKRFVIMASLRSHMRTYRNKNPYKCHICHKEIISKENFKDHLNIHSGKKPHKCNQCTKAYATRGGLASHLKTHNKPYTCHYCHAAFAYKSEYKNHVRYEEETDEELKCHICKKRYVNKYTLLKHNKQFHSKI